MASKDHKIPTEQQNGRTPGDSPGVHRTRKHSESSAAAVPNGVRQDMLVVCPEMCCYCFDILIAHLTNNQGSRNSFLKFFKNDE